MCDVACQMNVPQPTGVLKEIEERLPRSKTFAGALLLFLPITPIIATITSIVIFVIPWSKVRPSGWEASLSFLGPFLPLLFGTGIALLFWLLLSLICVRYTAVNCASIESFNAIIDHLVDLDDAIDTIKIASSGTQDPDLASEEKSEIQEKLQSYKNKILDSLGRSSISWITGTGYINLWKLINNAEETLFLVMPTARAISFAVEDEMRLDQSKIETRTEWINKLRTAVKNLDEKAVDYLKPASGAQKPASGEETANSLNSDPKAQKNARAILQLVRKTLNDFNTKSWSGLITARNQLVCTMILLGLTTYVAVEFVILTPVKTDYFVVATILALIGALAGLFGRLYSESQSDSAIDDYRLAAARLIVTPLLSGLAAVIGVMVVAKVSALHDLYSFKGILVNCVIAATFGLTPNLLMNQLQKKSEEYKSNLQSTKPTSGQG
jgi:hypothetical protein